ncbi:MAG: TRAP transporter fused permease subunit, partial [Acidobacteriota bacterium]
MQFFRFTTLIPALGVGLSLFQIWAVVFSTLDPLFHRAVFLAWILTFAFLSRGAGKPSPADLLLAASSVICGAYYVLNFERIQNRWPLVDPLTGPDLMVAVLVVLLVGELTRRSVGWPILLVAAFFSLFLLWGHRLPGTFSHRYFSLSEFLDSSVFTINGIFGAPLGVAATYVYLFILFGVLLHRSGGGDFFVDLAKFVAARTRGGAAKVAVVSCGLFGMLSGSPTSDAITTGTFTIPLMRKMGYSANSAGSIVAAAATGGSIMPPVMGSAVFLMAEFTGIPYVEIVIAACIPALLYYLSILLQVHFQALRMELKAAPLASDLGEVRRNLHFLIPLAVLVWSLLSGNTPTHAASLAIAATIVVSWLRPETRLGPKKIALALEEAARASIVVAAATASAGIVVITIAYSGIGGKITGLLLTFAGQSLLPVLLLTMIVCIILGMGMPVPSAYILTAVLIAPTLRSLGLPLLSTHLFMVYFAVMSAITPPVAVAAYAVAGLSKGNPNRI